MARARGEERSCVGYGGEVEREQGTKTELAFNDIFQKVLLKKDREYTRRSMFARSIVCGGLAGTSKLL
jgi:hypothetical protein